MDEWSRLDLIQKIFILLILSFALTSCARFVAPVTRPGSPRPYKVGSNWYQPMKTSEDFRQKGLASWYGKKFHGRKTSSGEIYDMYKMTAAHKTLPLGTYVRVTNLDNKKQTMVKVNDRGPFVSGRIIDLSFSAAKKIGVVGPGTAPVEIIALGAAVGSGNSGGAANRFRPENYFTGNFTFQVGAFKSIENARALKRQLDAKFVNAHIAVFDTGYEKIYRVRVGKYHSLKNIQTHRKTLVKKGFPDAFIVAE